MYNYLQLVKTQKANEFEKGGILQQRRQKCLETQPHSTPHPLAYFKSQKNQDGIDDGA